MRRPAGVEVIDWTRRFIVWRSQFAAIVRGITSVSINLGPLILYGLLSDKSPDSLSSRADSC